LDIGAVEGATRGRQLTVLRGNDQIEAVLGELPGEPRPIPLDAPVITAKPYASLIRCGYRRAARKPFRRPANGRHFG
jgi:hypothetical protein